MPYQPHATSAQYLSYTGFTTAPTDIERKLARASELVDFWTTEPYAKNGTTGIATDADQAAALRDATCAVVEAWETSDEVGDVQDGGQTSGPGREPTAGDLPPRAVRHLSLVGLL